MILRLTVTDSQRSASIMWTDRDSETCMIIKSFNNNICTNTCILFLHAINISFSPVLYPSFLINMALNCDGLLMFFYCKSLWIKVCTKGINGNINHTHFYKKCTGWFLIFDKLMWCMFRIFIICVFSLKHFYFFAV